MPATDFDDILNSTADRQVLHGLGGNDQLTANHRRVTLFGDAGNDVLSIGGAMGMM